MKLTATWKDGIKFQTVHKSGREYLMDATPPYGEGAAATPKEMVLMGLAGCTGMDVADILRKSRVKFDSLKVEVSAKQTEKHPKVFSSIHLKFLISGKDLDREKIEKAVSLSQDKYCGVSAMLKKTARITYEIQ